MRYRLSLLAILLVFSSGVLARQDDLKKRFTTRLSQIFKRYAKEVKTVQATGHVTMSSAIGSIKGELKVYLKGEYQRQDLKLTSIPGKSLKAALLANMNTITISRPNGIWEITPMGKYRIGKTSSKKPELDMSQWMERIIRAIGSVSLSKLGNKQVYEVTLNDGGSWKKAYFTKDMELIRVVGSHGKTQMVVEFSDFSPLGPLPFPHHMLIRVNGRPSVDVKLDVVKVNRTISNDLFDPDKVDIPHPVPTKEK